MIMSEVRSDLSVQAEKLFFKWIDSYLKLRIHDTGVPQLDGNMICPACTWLHGRAPDAVWPLTWAWKRTGDAKYLEAAKGLITWGRLNMERPNGAWINDPNAVWRGITIFGQTALGRAILLAGNDLPADTREEWLGVFQRTTTWCYNWLENPKTMVNVNYRAAYPIGMELAYRILKDEKYRISGDKQMEYVATYIADDGLFFGEASPSEKVSPRGLRGVDIGYNVEESLPAMLEWAELRGNRKLMERFLESANTHLEFLLPDGGLDNSFGSRAYKWTYWGSRSSDGILPTLVFLSKNGYSVANHAAKLVLDLYERCTGELGMLMAGIHYPESGEPVCVHHTFCHLKTFPMFIEANLPDGKGEQLFAEKPFGLKTFKTNDVSIIGVGEWRATVSANDLFFWDDVGKATGGGSLTLLHHRKVGPVFAASMSEWYLQEPGSMQQQVKDDVARCLTPRIETAEGVLKSVHDYSVKLDVAEKDGTVTSHAVGTLADKKGDHPDANAKFDLTWTFNVDSVAATATAAVPASFVVPVIAGTREEVVVSGDTVTVSKPAGKLILKANRQFTMENTDRSDNRAFSAQTGFLTAYLTLPVIPGEKTELKVRYSC